MVFGIDSRLISFGFLCGIAAFYLQAYIPSSSSSVHKNHFWSNFQKFQSKIPIVGNHFHDPEAGEDFVRVKPVRAKESENLFEWEKTEPLVKRNSKGVEKKGEVVVVLNEHGSYSSHHEVFSFSSIPEAVVLITPEWESSLPNKLEMSILQMGTEYKASAAFEVFKSYLFTGDLPLREEYTSLSSIPTQPLLSVPLPFINSKTPVFHISIPRNSAKRIEACLHVGEKLSSLKSSGISFIIFTSLQNNSNQQPSNSFIRSLSHLLTSHTAFPRTKELTDTLKVGMYPEIGGLYVAMGVASEDECEEVKSGGEVRGWKCEKGFDV